MRGPRLLLLGCLTALAAAQGPLRVVSVERRGLPPYEDAERLYRLDGGTTRGLRPGLRLAVKRPGEARVLGHFLLQEVKADQSLARFEGSGGVPMKGDVAWQEELAGLPAAPLVEGLLPAVATPAAGAVAPPMEGLLFFLPQRADLSPAGLRKVEAWVRAWGADGHWTIQVPAAKGLKPALQKQRAEALLAALRQQGVAQAQVQTEARSAEGKYDPAWIRRSDG